MARHPFIAVLALAFALIVPRAAWSDAPRAQPQRAAVSRSGVLGGADYRIEVPENWRGGLVVYAHGIERGPGTGTLVPPPIAHHIIGHGHAWIASGFFDAPGRQVFARLLNEGVVPALGMPGSYTARGRQFDSVVKYLMGLMGADAAGNDLPLRLQGLQRRYLLNMMHRPVDLETDPHPGLRAASTAHIRYRIDPGLGLTDDELNARVRRVHPAKDAPRRRQTR